MTALSGGGMASSPPSENGTVSYGTPSTDPTTFTPEGGAATKSLKERVNHARSQVALYRNDPLDDVFLNAPSSDRAFGRRQLSPTAEVFCPTAPLREEVGGPGRHALTFQGRVHAVNVYKAVVVPPVEVPHGSVSALLKGSAPERKAIALTPEQAHPVVPGVIGGPVVPGPVVPRSELKLSNFAGVKIQDVHFAYGIFSTDENTARAFIVSGVPEQYRSVDFIVSAFPTSSFPSLRTINASQLVSNGFFTLSFADVRQAKKAHEVCTSLIPLARVFPLSPKALAIDEGKDPLLVSDFEGQVVVTVYFNGYAHFNGKAKDAAAIIGEMQNMLTQCGDIKAFHAMAPTQAHVREFRVEFFDVDVVDAVKEKMSGFVTEHGTVMDAEAFKPDVRPVMSPRSGSVSPREQLSITGRSTVPVDPDYDRLAGVIQREALRSGRRINQSANHNAIDIARIQAGIDVRTTIMLRNIPNRVDQGMLKKLLDSTSHGRYDFMYLRIDFANNCNVGYAFINFLDAQSIIPFVLARAGKRWNCFASDKVAEVSYATIQGKDCLVQKFRNSSVMLEHPSFRPKLFIAGNVPNAGSEERFPGPDNASKMRRSVENAEHVGLFVLPSPPPARGSRPYGKSGMRLSSRNPYGGKGRRRVGHYLPPARATANSPGRFSSDEGTPRVITNFNAVNVNSPYDPFAGTPARFPAFRA
ncbi:Meiosis protein mei2 [Exophiala dermatitidis]